MKPPVFRRIVTHTDFDGLVGALLLREILKIDRVVFAEPWILQRGEYDVQPGDVIVDLPYDPRCAFWADHHASNTEIAVAAKKERPGRVLFNPRKKSCASLVRDAFCDHHPWLNEQRIIAMVEAADKIDTASFSREDLEHPDVWGRLSMSLKSDDRRKDDEYREFLLNLLTALPPEKVIEQPLVRDRVAKKEAEHNLFLANVTKYATFLPEERIVLLDLTTTPEEEGSAPPFTTYLLYPDADLSITITTIVHDDLRYKISVGKNIFSEESRSGTGLNIGEIMKRHGGGGHKAAGGCSVAREEKEEFLKALVKELRTK